MKRLSMDLAARLYLYWETWLCDGWLWLPVLIVAMIVAGLLLGGASDFDDCVDHLSCD